MCIEITDNVVLTRRSCSSLANVFMFNSISEYELIVSSKGNLSRLKRFSLFDKSIV